MMDSQTEEMLYVKCSREDFERLQELFESGELDKILDTEVVDIGITSTTKPVILSQWLKEIIEPTWEIINKFNNTPNLDFAVRTLNESTNQQNDSNISCKKVYNLGTSIDGNCVEVIVEIKLTQNQEEMDVDVRVQPCKNQPFLPTGLKLILLHDSEILAEVEAREADNTIQRGLTGEVGDNFSVKIALGDFSVLEDFTV